MRTLLIALAVAMFFSIGGFVDAGQITVSSYAYDPHVVATTLSVPDTRVQIMFYDTVPTNHGAAELASPAALTDGVIGADGSVEGNYLWITGKYVGFMSFDAAKTNPQPGITFTLPEAYNLEKMVVYYGCRPGSGLLPLTGATVTAGAGSVTDTTFGSDAADAAEAAGKGDARVHEINLAGLSGSTVHLAINNLGLTGSGLATWALLSEVQIFGTPVPEPSTIASLVMGMIGLLAYAWRRRK